MVGEGSLLLWVGMARHPCPFSGSMSVEVSILVVGSLMEIWLWETPVDFLAVIEHRLVPARVRGEWARLLARGASSVWSPASPGILPCWSWWCWGVSLRAPLSLPTSATAQSGVFLIVVVRYVVCCLLPLVVFALGCSLWYQGADGDAEQLSLTDQLFDAALGELRVVALDQPCLIVGDFNVEPPKSLACLKGFLLGSGLIWSRLGPLLLVCLLLPLVSVLGMILGVIVGIFGWLSFGCGCGSSCSVGLDRWVVPHLAVRASFFTPLGLLEFSAVKRTPSLACSWCLLLTSLVVLNLLRFRGFGRFMMRGYSLCLGRMPWGWMRHFFSG